MLVSAAVFPVLMIVLMSQVFRGIAESPAFPLDSRFPTIASNSAVGIASDLTTGMLDRLQAMPVRSWTVLVGRSAADVIISIGQVTIVVAVAVVLGFTPATRLSRCLPG